MTILIPSISWTCDKETELKLQKCLDCCFLLSIFKHFCLGWGQGTRVRSSAWITYPSVGLGIHINVSVHDLGQSVAISTRKRKMAENVIWARKDAGGGAQVEQCQNRARPQPLAGLCQSFCTGDTWLWLRLGYALGECQAGP